MLPYRKPKRIRTAFSPNQLLKLEQAFEKNHYVVGAERKQLAASLNLTETQVSDRLPANVTDHRVHVHSQHNSGQDQARAAAQLSLNCKCLNLKVAVNFEDL